MNNVSCDKPGHGAYPLRACEKDGKIFVDMDSCTECGPQKMEEEEVLTTDKHRFTQIISSKTKTW